MKKKEKIIRTTKVTVEYKKSCCPSRAHITDAAYDLYTSEAYPVKPHTRIAVSLGFRVSMPPSLAMIIQPRSGQSANGLIAQSVAPVWLGSKISEERIDADPIVGLIDYGYGKDVKGIVRVGRFTIRQRLMSLLGYRFLIPARSRICQGRFVSVPNTTIVVGNVFGTRDGLGSTDK